MSHHTEPDQIPESVDLPTPTAWPMLCAMGLALLLAGLVTSFFVSIVGLILGVIAAKGWFSDVYPHPKHEPFPIRPPAERAAPVSTSARRVDHLTVGKNKHRVRLPIEVHPYSAGIIGGLVGGVVMAILAMVYGIAFEGSIWWPINLLAASGVPSLAVASAETLHQFSFAGLVVAIIVHFSLSMMVGLLYTVLLPMLPVKFAWFWAGIVTPLIWTSVVWAGVGVLNPALAEYIVWPWFIVCQVAFGLTGGFVIFKIGKVETMQTWSLAAKMGVEAQEEE